MAHTVFILGTDPQQCKELREILQGRIADAIVTSSGENLPRIQESDTVIITSEEKNTGVLYRRLLNRLEDQVRRAQFLSELMRLFSSSLQIEDMLEKVVAKTTQFLGDTAFILLVNDSGTLRVEAAHSANPGQTVKILMSALNLAPKGLSTKLLGEVLEAKRPCLIANLHQVEIPPDLRIFVDKYGFLSLVATPIQSKDRVLGVFVSLSTSPKTLDEADLKFAAELSDFTAIALENASLFAELQRSAITDSLTGLYNTRFFNELLAREAARADRYSTPLSLLMIDVDGFKVVNDTYGHVVGNKVLTHIGGILQKVVRTTDSVFRCGGDEFGVVLPGTHLDGAMNVAEKILHRVDSSEMLTTLGYSGGVTVSIGVSEYRRGSHFETLVAEADQALYTSKRSSKNCAKAFGR
jgi:two-component system cell cycle response regulator